MVYIRLSLDAQADLPLDHSAFIILYFFGRGQIIGLHKNHLKGLPVHLYLLCLLINFRQAVSGVHHIHSFLDKRTAADFYINAAGKDTRRNRLAKQTAQLHTA
ncbi:hypothetical protein D3C81_1280480 [compost metagenome]